MMNLIIPTEWPPFHDSNGNNEFDYVDFMPKNEMRLDLLQSVTLGFLIIKKSARGEVNMYLGAPTCLVKWI